MAALLGSYWRWYTAPSQPGSTASVFSQATWPYTPFARKTGKTNPHRVAPDFRQMLTSDVLHGTSMQQSIDCCVNALLQHKLRSSTLQVFGTNGCIFIRQIQLLTLRLMGQGISDNVHRSLSVQYGYGQLIHTFEPTCLTSAKVRLHK